jgi:tetratricopeptide (TPR) repeat protein
MIDRRTAVWEATMKLSCIRLAALIVGAFALLAAAPQRAAAVDTNTPAADPPQPRSAPASKPAPKSSKKKKTPKKNQKRSDQHFIDGYRAAHAMIYQRGEFSAGIDKLKSLGRDEHPDVANLIGYSSRKLGRYDDAKLWYERALAADPRHARTWSYYGMWHAEQGNVLKARDHLAKVETLCGTGCREYTELKSVIEGTRVY